MTHPHAHTANAASQADDQRLLQLAHDTLEIEADAVRHPREATT
jgi:hypothetical protein